MPTAAATVGNPYDHNRDGRVNSIDLATTRLYQSAGLAALGHPVPTAPGLTAPLPTAPTHTRRAPNRIATYVPFARR